MNAPIIQPLTATPHIIPVTNNEKEKPEHGCGQDDCIAPQPQESVTTDAAKPAANDEKDNTDADPDATVEMIPYPDEEEIQASFEPPVYMAKLLQDMQHFLLPGENDDEFLCLFEELEDHFNIRDMTEYGMIFDYTCLKLELLRYARMKVGIERNTRRAAVETIFRRLSNGKIPKDEIGEYFSEPEFQAQTRKDFEQAGFSLDAVEVEAFQRSLPSIAAVDKLIASGQKRIATFTKELEKRHAVRVKEYNRKVAEWNDL
jgi:hypothetical protein